MVQRDLTGKEINGPLMNRVICAAIRKDGKIYCGPRHDWIFNNHSVKGGEQGFVDQKGRFMDRKLALRLATFRRQIIEKHPPLDGLQSEDIY